MMAGNPNPNSWWSMHNTVPDLMIRSSSTAASDHHHHHHDHAPSSNFLSSNSLSQTHPNSNTSLFPLHEYLSSSSNSKSSSSSSPPSSSPSSFLPLTSLPHHHHHQHHQQQQHQLPHDFPHSWSQLLLGGLGSDQEEKYGANLFQSTRSDVKQEEISQRNTNNNGNDLYGYNNHDHEEQEAGISDRLAIIPPPNAAWSSQNMPISSPRSCVTTLSSNSNMLDFSITNKRSLQPQTTNHQHVDRSNSECNSNGSGGVPKKPRVQSSNPPLKVRKEKLGDRITALHQLVSPFGKTDTASVLLEAIGYIRFLQAQIQALSSPYLGHNNNNPALKNQYSDNMDAPKGLRSRGLCLVPTSCTHLVGNDNGADYWAQMQSLGGGF